MNLPLTDRESLINELYNFGEIKKRKIYYEDEKQYDPIDTSYIDLPQFRKPLNQ